MADVIGTLLNGLCILIGGGIGRTVVRPLSPSTQRRLKVLLGVFTVYVGLSATWTALAGPLGYVFRQAALLLVALMLGKLTGHLLRLQRGMNRVGRYVKEQFTRAQGVAAPPWSVGFVVCSLLYCAEPLALLGAVQEGLQADSKPLVIKGITDGLATIAFSQCFGWGALGAALPVVAYQGTLTLGIRVLGPWLEHRALVEPIQAAAGLLLFVVALVILEIRKVELADYLPSLVYAPLLAGLLR